jgi:alcohol dehydrogenase (cytochrome c)
MCTKSRSASAAAKHMLGGGVLAAAALAPLLSFADMPAYPAVTSERLLNAQQDQGWLMYRRNYESTGYAPFEQITTANAAKLAPAFDYESNLFQGHEAAPVVNGNYMFVTTPMDHLIALDAVTGKVLWRYDYPIDQKALKTVCCDVVNRGVALYDDLVYMGTLGNHIVALDAKTGTVKWDTALAPPGVGYFISGAPLVVNGKLIIGDGGGEYGARGFVVALNAKTGAVEWKTYTTAAPGTPGGDTWPKGAYKTGGGNPWITGTYDHATNTLFWGVGNPGPWLATLRPGDNLYTDSVLALDPNTGKIKWHYQWTPNDTWDYDGANETVMTDLTYQGTAHKAIVHADRNGWFYAVDRTNGKLIYAEPFVHTTSITGMKDGVPQSDEAMRPTVDKQVFTCPSFLGGKNWWPISVDPQTHMAYIPTQHACMDIKGAQPVAYKAGLAFLDETFTVKHDPTTDNWGSVQAVDLNTGKQVWQYETHLPWSGATLATAGGLMFSGSTDGHFMAFDAKTGKVVWTSPQLTSGIIGVPTTYMANGKQYVAVWAGWGGAGPIWGGDMANDPAVKAIPKGGHLYVFALQ